ncbi:Sec-independent protein translocase protein TatB [Nakamurella endophytica]|uniref:Sec-independent protein translocase protein TatB n=1 Tax=Nakamurella endophytica TaxID=1748367 RepID=A0A917STS2_9ACTN|nr:Sec-independent protein translocase protein TatB [Nakamurella endophytica]GGL95771.1 hypothetical protein GCM10011594_14320 [Nakamurella endophytica]
MFGLSWAQIIIIVLVGVFVLGPERIPTAVQWVTSSLRKVRTMAAGAQAQLRSEIGPELDELRRQIADLQSLKEIQELRELRDLHPRNLIGKGLLGQDGATGSGGGLSGLLGFDSSLLDPPVTGSGVADPPPPAHGAADVPAVGGDGASAAAQPVTYGAPDDGVDPLDDHRNGHAGGAVDMTKPVSPGGPAEWAVTPSAVATAEAPPPFDPDAT